MATISVPNTFVNNSQIADATQVNANFAAITSGIVNGVNDMNFANLVVQSAATFLGPQTIASSVGFVQSATFSGAVYHYSSAYFASQHEARFYHATSALTGFYVGMRAATALTASYDIRLPDAPAATAKFLGYNGTNYTWANTNSLQPVANKSSAAVTASATDGGLNVTTGASSVTVNLPAAATNSGLVLSISKADTGVGFVLVDPNSSELINGYSKVTLHLIGEAVTIQCNGTGWVIIGYQSSKEATWAPTYTASSGSPSAPVTTVAQWWKSAIDQVSFQLLGSVTTGATPVSINFSLPVNTTDFAKSASLMVPFSGYTARTSASGVVLSFSSAAIAAMTKITTAWPNTTLVDFSGTGTYKIDPAA